MRVGLCLDNGDNRLPGAAQDGEGFFSACAEAAFDAFDAEAVHHVLGEPERGSLRRRQQPAALKRDAEINMHHLGSVGVQQDVACMPVAQADDVSSDG
jgi:hypothetical protein